MITSVMNAFWQEEDGQDLVEYSLLLAFIALAAVALLSQASSSINTIWKNISTNLANAATAAS
ncbi:MAG: Flp family type IVb pilin [Bryobacteraceae bacterium]